MNYKCPACASALYYDPSVQLLKCNSCGNLYRPSDFDNSQNLSYSEKQDTANQEIQSQQYSQMNAHREQMECKMYHCNSCGAELVVNGEEAATFCAYCGQPAIVFQRIASQIKPDYIIPFRITKEQAFESIQQKFAKSKFIPSELRNIKIEKVHGVYVPFWLYNIHYYDNQYLKGTVEHEKSTSTEYFIREATCDFVNITQDASLNLPDYSSRRLEPYDMSELVPFDASYLSGFYADKYERDARDFEKDVIMRASELFNSNVFQSVNAKNVSILYNRPFCEISSASYALLPVWFFTYHHESQAYSILVNGQTGKLVSAAPPDKKKIVLRFAAIFAVLAVILGLIFQGITGNMVSKDRNTFVVFIIIIISVCFMMGVAQFKAVKNNLKYARSVETLNYSTKRQDIN